MPAWPKHPLIYEINTRVWLDELSRRARRPLTLASVPDDEWARLAALGCDAIWLMGVWERSPAGVAIANRDPQLLAELRRALPDFRREDNTGSPYCVRRYEVDSHFGGRAALAAARAAMARHGLRLVLDFVANHVAPDHPWVAEHPDYFVRGTPEDYAAHPQAFMRIGNTVFACGRDPYFPAWPDVLQLNAFSPALREAIAGTLQDVASQCDAVRCDMAMLLMNEVFARTWGDRAGHSPDVEYWPPIITAVGARHPDFRFIAEAYWDLEWALQQQGFDYCYDKRLYDRLAQGDAEGIRQHLSADVSYQERLIRFIENHDEPRAAAAFSGQRARAAAVVALTQTGARLVHDGQREGRKVRVPVFLARRPVEPIDRSLVAFYDALLAATAGEAFRSGEWRLCERSGWPDNPSVRNLVAWARWLDGHRYLIVVNWSDEPSQGRVHLPWRDLAGAAWHLDDSINREAFQRDGDELADAGLYVDLKPWAFHFLQIQRATPL